VAISINDFVHVFIKDDDGAVRLHQYVKSSEGEASPEVALCMDAKLANTVATSPPDSKVKIHQCSRCLAEQAKLISAV
jgi:hypothetical protein